MVNCDDCVKKEHCDLFLESNGNVNMDYCLCKTWYDENGKLDNNTRKYFDHEELK